MVTITNLESEIENLQLKTQSVKERKLEIRQEWKDLSLEGKKIKLQISQLTEQIRSLKIKEKVSAKEAALLRAKEAAASLGVVATGRKRTDTSEAVAAHRSEGSLLEGNLNDPVDIEDLKSDLDIF